MVAYEVGSPYEQAADIANVLTSNLYRNFHRRLVARPVGALIGGTYFDHRLCQVNVCVAKLPRTAILYNILIIALY